MPCPRLGHRLSLTVCPSFERTGSYELALIWLFGTMPEHGEAAPRTPVLTLWLDAPRIDTVEEIADFLAQFPPFDVLSRDELLHVAATVAVRSYPAGTDILVEDGPPAAEFFVIRKGSVELRHQDEVVDILEPGE